MAKIRQITNLNEHGQTSWDKFTFVARFSHAPNEQPGANSSTYVQPPLYNDGHVYTLLLQRFNIVCWEGGKATHFETETSAFSKLRFQHTEN